jgi:glyoxalase superfamily protein
LEKQHRYYEFSTQPKRRSSISISSASKSIGNIVSKTAYRYICKSQKDGCIIHLSEHYGDCCHGAAVRIETNELETFQKQLLAKNSKYARPGIEQMPWGTSDMSIADPSGNRLTFTSAISA